MSLVTAYSDVIQLLVQTDFLTGPLDDNTIQNFEIPDRGVIEQRISQLPAPPENWRERYAAFSEDVSKLKSAKNEILIRNVAFQIHFAQAQLKELIEHDETEAYVYFDSVYSMAKILNELTDKILSSRNIESSWIQKNLKAIQQIRINILKHCIPEIAKGPYHSSINLIVVFLNELEGKLDAPLSNLRKLEETRQTVREIITQEVKAALSFCNRMKNLLSQKNGSKTQKENWLLEMAEVLKNGNFLIRDLELNDPIFKAYHKLAQFVRFYRMTSQSDQNRPDEDIQPVLEIHQSGIEHIINKLCHYFLSQAEESLHLHSSFFDAEEYEGLKRRIGIVNNQIGRETRLSEEDDVLVRASLDEDLNKILRDFDWAFLKGSADETTEKLDIQALSLERDCAGAVLNSLEPLAITFPNREEIYNLLGLLNIMIAEGHCFLKSFSDGNRVGIYCDFTSGNFDWIAFWDADSKGLTFWVVQKVEGEENSPNPVIDDVHSLKLKIHDVIERLNNSKNGLRFLNNMSRLCFVFYNGNEHELLEYQQVKDTKRFVPMTSIVDLDNHLRSFETQTSAFETLLSLKNRVGPDKILEVAENLGIQARELNDNTPHLKSLAYNYLQLAQAMVKHLEVENGNRDEKLNAGIQRTRVKLKAHLFWADVDSRRIVDAVQSQDYQGIERGLGTKRTVLDGIKNIYQSYASQLRSQIAISLNDNREDHFDSAVDLSGRLAQRSHQRVQSISRQLAKRARSMRGR